METKLIEIRNQQRDTWNKFSGGWKKYNDFTMEFLKPMGDVIIQQLTIQETDHVLDIATGTGEPGLTIAKLATKGKVIATDVAADMLTAAKETAANQGLENFETMVADACELPFDDNSFDKISCRMGFMFFPDMQLAANEMFRVLKSGGKLSTSVWYNPQRNNWISGILGIINKNMQLPAPPANAPSMFRCAQPGAIKTILEKAGFKNIQEQEVGGKRNYDNFHYFWTMMNEVAAPVVGAIAKADETMRTKIKDEVKIFADAHMENGSLLLDYNALVLCAEK